MRLMHRGVNRAAIFLETADTYASAFVSPQCPPTRISR